MDIGENSSVILSRRKFHTGNKCAYEITKGLEEEVLGGSPGAGTKRTTHTGLAEGHDFSIVGKLENQAVPRATLGSEVKLP